MADNKNKKPKAIYSPGELEKVRENLGPMDRDEAIRMAEILGGEVGIEKTPEQVKNETLRHKGVSGVSLSEGGSGDSSKKRTIRSVEVKGDGLPVHIMAPGIPKVSYSDRVGMDALMAHSLYRIKTPSQLFFSRLNFWGEPSEKLNPVFIMEILPEYCSHIEKLVISAKRLLPRSINGEEPPLKQVSPISFEVLNLIKSWDLKTLSNELNMLQKNPRLVTVLQMKPIMRLIYTIPMKLYYINDATISTAFQTAYKVLSTNKSLEVKFNPGLVAKDGILEWSTVRDRVLRGLYPLLLRLCSPILLTYQELMTQNFSRVKAFLVLGKGDFVKPPAEKDAALSSLSEDEKKSVVTEKAENAKKMEIKAGEIPSSDNGEKKEAALPQLPKAVFTGLGNLNKLFPEAGWFSIEKKPDLYSYMETLFSFPDGMDIISPDNPMQLAIILVRIIEELLFGFRAIEFSDTAENHYATDINRIIGEWRLYRDELLEKKYLPYINEYCHQLDLQPDFRYSTYAKRVMSDLGWITKQYFFPKFVSESIAFTRPLKNEGIEPLYKDVSVFRKLLASLAKELGESIKQGVVKPKDRVQGVINPWVPYSFLVSNPVSKRLDAVLGGKNSKTKTNANLIYYTLSIVTVLDWWVNSPDSYAYTNLFQGLYRIKQGDSVQPDFHVDVRTDISALFAKSLKLSDTSDIREDFGK